MWLVDFAVWFIGAAVYLVLLLRGMWLARYVKVPDGGAGRYGRAIAAITWAARVAGVCLAYSLVRFTLRDQSDWIDLAMWSTYLIVAILVRRLTHSTRQHHQRREELYRDRSALQEQLMDWPPPGRNDNSAT